VEGDAVAAIAIDLVGSPAAAALIVGAGEHFGWNDLKFGLRSVTTPKGIGSYI
jgi:hypothetical protein